MIKSLFRKPKINRQTFTGYKAPPALTRWLKADRASAYVLLGFSRRRILYFGGATIDSSECTFRLWPISIPDSGPDRIVRFKVHFSGGPGILSGLARSALHLKTTYSFRGQEKPVAPMILSVLLCNKSIPAQWPGALLPPASQRKRVFECNGRLRRARRVGR